MKTDYFLGVGQGKRARQRLHEIFPGISFHIPPNYLCCNTDEQIAKTAEGYVAKALESSEAQVIMAESQAAPAVVAALASGDVAMPERLVLLQPLGLNRTSLGSDPVLRRKELFRRSRLFWSHKHQSLSIAGNRWTLLVVVSQSLRYVKNLNKAYEIGASADIVSALAQIAARIPVDVYGSTDDSLFPFRELQKVQAVTMHELPGTHLNRATPLGIAQLIEVLGDSLSRSRS